MPRASAIVLWVMQALSLNNRKALLELARKALETYLETGDHLTLPADPAEFHLKRGCFITLRKAGALRGCVGTFDSSHALGDHVIRMAIASGFQDRRFPPLTKQELAHVRIEISVLGELQRVEGLEEIKIGRDGIYVKLGERSGTFLPEVAVELNWSVAEFVAYCAREKAGLTPAECSRAEIYRYEIEKFKED